MVQGGGVEIGRFRLQDLVVVAGGVGSATQGSVRSGFKQSDTVSDHLISASHVILCHLTSCHIISSHVISSHLPDLRPRVASRPLAAFEAKGPQGLSSLGNPSV